MASDYVEMKLLKMLNDAHVPHFLYRDILQWGKEAKQLKYHNFMPQCFTRKVQIKHTEKW
jgi:hypothetical protein